MGRGRRGRRRESHSENSRGGVAAGKGKEKEREGERMAGGKRQLLHLGPPLALTNKCVSHSYSSFRHAKSSNDSFYSTRLMVYYILYWKSSEQDK